MKKNDYLLLTATGAYSMLFFQQNAGINFLIFSVVLITILIIKNKHLLNHKKWLWSAALCLISATSVFVHSSALAIIANIISLLLVSAFSFNIVTSSIFSFLFSCYTVISCMVYIIVDYIARLQPRSEAISSKRGYKVLATFIVLILSILFLNLYQSSNPLFASNTKWINFDFISVTWIFFTLGGFLLMYSFLYHQTIKPIEVWENKLSLKNAVVQENESIGKHYETERFGGLLLFIVLNVMLIVLNVGDIQTLYFGGGLPKGVTHSDFVHNGVGVIIFSIIIATSLMLFLFRKEFISIKNNKALIACIYLWIGQNILMLSSTAIRNQLYIHDYNFTYKRIGVYVWLLLAVIGLLIMFWKIYKKRSTWYLIKTNIAIWFTVLALSSVVNWDIVITRYNINNKPLKDVDFYYLFSLSDANLPDLIAISKKPECKQFEDSLRNYSDLNQRYYGVTYNQLLNDKLIHYLSDYTNDWRSYDLRDQNIINSIYISKK